MTVALLTVGLVLLLSGGFALVHGSSHLARRLGVPPFIVGLTVVAFGTSAPELAVNVAAGLAGDSGISFGNVIGSNIANIGLILGVAGLIAPLAIDSVVLAREIPIMLLATAVALALGLDTLLRGMPGTFDRSDGVVLLLVFTVFLYTATMTVLRRRETDALVQQAADVAAKPLSVPRSSALVIAGLTALIGGAELTVANAVTLAAAVGVSPAIVGLTAVAVGTSLPELIASSIAALRGESDLAVGNVVGSNIFNLLFVLGISATLSPVPVPPGGLGDLLVLVVLSLLVLGIAATGRRITKVEGGVLLVLWVGYTVFRLIPTG